MLKILFYKILMFFLKPYLIPNKIKKILSIFITYYKFVNYKEVKPTHLQYGQLRKDRAIDMLKILDKKIKEHDNREKFIFVEIGNYLGESLKLYGNHIHNKLDDYLLISIDPYVTYINENLDVNKYGWHNLCSKNILKVYRYFTHNVGTYVFKHNHFHLRMNSNKAFDLLKSFNIKIDFCYIDGSHYYQDIKDDYTNYKSLLKNYKNNKGIICGDDYEYKFEDLKNLLDISEDKILKMLNDNKKTDYLEVKDKFGKSISFHPGCTMFFYESNDKINKFNSGFWLS